MKKLLIILSPYILFCLIFSIPFILKPSKHNKDSDFENDSTIIDSTIIEDDIIEPTIDSLKNLEEELNGDLIGKSEELIVLQDDAQYKLIVGSFKSKLKAQELSDNLSREGYEPRIIKNESLLRVCVAFSNSDQEIAEIKTSLESKGYKPWILKSFN